MNILSTGCQGDFSCNNIGSLYRLRKRKLERLLNEQKPFYIIRWNRSLKKIHLIELLYHLILDKKHQNNTSWFWPSRLIPGDCRNRATISVEFWDFFWNVAVCSVFPQVKSSQRSAQLFQRSTFSLTKINLFSPVMMEISPSFCHLAVFPLWRPAHTQTEMWILICFDHRTYDMPKNIKRINSLIFRHKSLLRLFGGLVFFFVFFLMGPQQYLNSLCR